VCVGVSTFKAPEGCVAAGKAGREHWVHICVCVCVRAHAWACRVERLNTVCCRVGARRMAAGEGPVAPAKAFHAHHSRAKAPDLAGDEEGNGIVQLLSAMQVGRPPLPATQHACCFRPPLAQPVPSLRICRAVQSAADIAADIAAVQSSADKAAVQPTAGIAAVQSTANTAAVESTADIAAVQSTADIAAVQSTADTAAVVSTADIAAVQSTADIAAGFIADTAAGIAAEFTDNTAADIATQL